jgi:sulfatase modifying factor 1
MRRAIQSADPLASSAGRPPLSLDGKSGCCTPAGNHPATTATPTVSQAAEPLDAALSRMIPLPGGTFLMGTDTLDGFPRDGEGPVRAITLAPFSIDRFPVTNDLFAQFILATGYITDAERFGWSFVFWSHLPEATFDDLVEDTVAGAPWWCKVPGAAWSKPEGPGSTIAMRGDHPVVHVSWSDAQAFCHWSNQRLPTEAEWEYAARGGLVQQLYPWGDELQPDGKHRCNIWQGQFPSIDTGEDGFTGTCPVAAFPPNAFGLSSVTGNTWEWCADWFDPTFHVTGPRLNPHGPPDGLTRVIRGGSFLCHASYCNRYRVAARSANTPDSSTSNTGFRCAR